MKNKDIIEWMLDEGIDPLTKVNTKDGEIYLSDILAKHLIEQLRIHDVVNSVCYHPGLLPGGTTAEICWKCGEMVLKK